MIQVRKLMSLSPGHRMRKASQTLERMELWLRAALSGTSAVPADGLSREAALSWMAEMALGFGKDEELPAETRALASALAEITRVDVAGTAAIGEPWLGKAIASVNRLRRSLEAASGAAPADWDFAEPLGLALNPEGRRVFPGVRAYLEDLRSPFNVGSAFRSADACGVAELLLSGFTADPLHPRAVRSAMGTVSTVPWRRASLAELPAFGEILALELRGQSVDEFEFPASGTVIVGSEELGVSPEALALCGRTVSIPMLGAKGSLNAGVAFGIVMNAWRASLESRGLAAEPERR